MKFKHLVSVFLATVISASSYLKAEDFAFVVDPVVKQRLTGIKAEFESLPKDQSKSYQTLKAAAIEANNNGKFFTALITATDAMKIFTKDIDLLLLIGICYAQLDKPVEAEVFYNKALEIQPHHAPSILNLIELNLYHGDFEKVVKRVVYIREYLKSAGHETSPLLEYKYLLALTKLSEKQADKYAADLKKMQELYSYNDDHPYYYYVKALDSLKKGDNDAGQVWIYKAAKIFGNMKLIDTWNKSLKDTNYLADHDIMISARANNN